ncbi:hypothetical protein BT69DRAFT_1278885 [Atractiella rhizophila]|nr:hypothetical protein BT69DRAFT_1278885 [Atractiella rhizophila]
MGSPKDISFSCAKEDMVATYLGLKTGLTFGSKNLDQSIIDTKVASSNNQAYMSSEQFLMHLTMIENSVPPINEAASRVRIDAFLFRLHAMCPNDHYTMFSLEMHSQALSIEAVHQKPFNVHGYIDYTIILSSIKAKTSFIPNLTSGTSLKIDNLKGACPKSVAFFVLEAKTLDTKLVNHLPQAQLELYACAQQFGVSIIRGCLSSGREWIFLYLQLAEDGKVYFRNSTSIRYTVDWNFDKFHMSIARGKNDPNHISILLDHWVKNSQKPLTEDNDGEFFSILDDPNQPRQ